MEENSRLRSEVDSALQVRELAVADATRLWQLVHRLGGDSAKRDSQGMGNGSRGIGRGSPRETQKVIPSPTSKGRRKN